ncbi:unnamed protein product [Schistosoma mattheei]|uniref:Uncharacterized protein n=1 Tax=Schistosoma mattheei TaxID=31246 RepID=A0A183PF08_9TREM|nr:unnamed protein product [Schistosoma mattheei]
MVSMRPTVFIGKDNTRYIRRNNRYIISTSIIVISTIRIYIIITKAPIIVHMRIVMKYNIGIFIMQVSTIVMRFSILIAITVGSTSSNGNRNGSIRSTTTWARQTRRSSTVPMSATSTKNKSNLLIFTANINITVVTFNIRIILTVLIVLVIIIVIVVIIIILFVLIFAKDIIVFLLFLTIITFSTLAGTSFIFIIINKYHRSSFLIPVAYTTPRLMDVFIVIRINDHIGLGSQNIIKNAIKT